MAKQFYLGEGIHLPRVVIADEAVFPEPAPTGIEALSPTERRMVFMIAKSMTSAEFAKKLRISIRTVETHRLNASRKLGFSGANSLLRFALAHSYELEALID